MSGFDEDSLYNGDTDDYDLNKIKESIKRIKKVIVYFKANLSSYLFKNYRRKNKNIYDENIKEVTPLCFSKNFDEKYCKLFYGSTWLKFNSVAKKLIQSKYFEIFIVGITVLSCIGLVIKLF